MALAEGSGVYQRPRPNFSPHQSSPFVAGALNMAQSPYGQAAARTALGMPAYAQGVAPTGFRPTGRTAPRAQMAAMAAAPTGWGRSRLDKFGRGFFSAFDVTQYPNIPGNLAYAAQHPGDAIHHILTTPEGLGGLATLAIPFAPKGVGALRSASAVGRGVEEAGLGARVSSYPGGVVTNPEQIGRMGAHESTGLAELNRRIMEPHLQSADLLRRRESLLGGPSAMRQYISPQAQRLVDEAAAQPTSGKAFTRGSSGFAGRMPVGAPKPFNYSDVRPPIQSSRLEGLNAWLEARNPIPLTAAATGLAATPTIAAYLMGYGRRK